MSKVMILLDESLRLYNHARNALAYPFSRLTTHYAYIMLVYKGAVAITQLYNASCAEPNTETRLHPASPVC